MDKVTRFSMASEKGNNSASDFDCTACGNAVAVFFFFHFLKFFRIDCITFRTAVAFVLLYHVNDGK